MALHRGDTILTQFGKAKVVGSQTSTGRVKVRIGNGRPFNIKVDKNNT